MSDVLIAPFSNSTIRDWPTGHFTVLVGLLLERLPSPIGVRIIGTASQRLRAADIVRAPPAARVGNDCGRLSWAQLLDRLKTAECVVANNSGVGHLGGYLDIPTVCIFGGSHERHEWRPLGESVTLLSRTIGCSPCHLDHSVGSPYDKACLREIPPHAVADAVCQAIARSGSRRPEA